SGDANTGSYDVNLTFVSDSPSACAEPIACGQTLSRSIDAVGESDAFHFRAAAGDTVSITSSGTGKGLIACWTLYDAQGLSVTNVCGPFATTLAVLCLHAARPFDSGDLSTGTYDVNIVVVSDTAGTCAQTISCGQTLSGSIDEAGQSNSYKFSVEANET